MTGAGLVLFTGGLLGAVMAFRLAPAISDRSVLLCGLWQHDPGQARELTTSTTGSELRKAAATLRETAA
jgi:hypothetical protein